MKKTLCYLICLIVLIQSVAALSVTRTFSKTSVSTGETITITYAPDTTNIKYWDISDTIPPGWTVTLPQVYLGQSGGCKVEGSSFNCYSASESPGGTASSVPVSWKAPSSAATSSFTGTYHAETTIGNFPAQTVTVGSSPGCTNGQTQSCTVGGCAGTQTCTNGAWGSCVKNDPNCGVGPVCGNGQCESGETCSSCAADCGQCSQTVTCWICSNGACTSTTRTNNCQTNEYISQSACTSACTAPTPEKTCSANDDCQFYEKCVDSECKFDNKWLIIGGLILGGFIVLSKM